MSLLRTNAIWRGVCPLLGESLFIWAQGCPKRCPGCFNTAALDVNGRAMRRRPATLARIWARGRGGLVLSGGEPFLQAAALADLCARVRAIDPTAPVLTYTGFCLEELLTEGRPGYIDLLRQTDVLVDGPYLQEVPSSVALMGSGNQRVIFLGDRVDPRRMNNMAAAQVQASVGASGKLRLVGTGGVDMRRVVGALRKHGLEVKAPDAR